MLTLFKSTVQIAFSPKGLTGCFDLCKWFTKRNDRPLCYNTDEVNWRFNHLTGCFVSFGELLNLKCVCIMVDTDAYCLIFWQLLPIHTLRLGVELDTFDGHHYISSIASDGPAATLGLLQLEDELLEVKTKQKKSTNIFFNPSLKDSY